MRNGNIFFRIGISILYSVLILPMRNGNTENSEILLKRVIGSYPTYEEWKLVIQHLMHSLMYQVLILPMRNGNLITGEVFLQENGFLSYL